MLWSNFMILTYDQQFHSAQLKSKYANSTIDVTCTKFLPRARCVLYEFHLLINRSSIVPNIVP